MSTPQCPLDIAILLRNLHCPVPTPHPWSFPILALASPPHPPQPHWVVVSPCSHSPNSERTSAACKEAVLRSQTTLCAPMAVSRPLALLLCLGALALCLSPASAAKKPLSPPPPLPLPPPPSPSPRRPFHKRPLPSLRNGQGPAGPHLRGQGRQRKLPPLPCPGRLLLLQRDLHPTRLWAPATGRGPAALRVREGHHHQGEPSPSSPPRRLI